MGTGKPWAFSALLPIATLWQSPRAHGSPDIDPVPLSGAPFAADPAPAGPLAAARGCPCAAAAEGAAAGESGPATPGPQLAPVRQACGDCAPRWTKHTRNYEKV